MKGHMTEGEIYRNSGIAFNPSIRGQENVGFENPRE